VAFVLGGGPALTAAPTPTDSPGPSTTRPADERPDLSQYDAPTLRAIAERLMTAMAAAKQRLEASDAEVARLTKENAALAKKNESLSDRVAKLEKELAARDAGVAAPRQTPAIPASKPGVSKFKGGDAAIAERIRTQKESFAELNRDPAGRLGKALTVLGYASRTDYSSSGVFSDPDSPRRFLSLIDTDGAEIYLSYAKEGNDKLTELLAATGRDKRVPLKLEVIGTATRQFTVFEAAIQKWEAMK
jgi:hypothetical protein